MMGMHEPGGCRGNSELVCDVTHHDVIVVPPPHFGAQLDEVAVSNELAHLGCQGTTDAESAAAVQEICFCDVIAPDKTSWFLLAQLKLDYFLTFLKLNVHMLNYCYNIVKSIFYRFL